MLAALIDCLQYPFPLSTARLIQPRPFFFPLAFQRVKMHTTTIFVIAEDFATVVWYLPFGLKVISVMFESLPLNVVLAWLRLMIIAARFVVVGTETVSIKVSDFSYRMWTRPFLDIKVWNASFHGGRRVDKSAFVHVYYLSTFWRGVFQHVCGVDLCEKKRFYSFEILSKWPR
jgi:hypothetical protein